MGKKVTLAKIATVAGVSVATVSRVLRGKVRVSPELEAHVRSSALQLGVNLSERSGVRAFGFLVCNRRSLHEFYSRVLLAAEEYCAAHDYNLMFASLNYDSKIDLQDVHLPAVLRHKNVVCGYIVVGRIWPKLLEHLRGEGIPLAVLGNHVQGEWPAKQYDIVWFDDVQGTYELTRFLQSLGHRKLCFIGHSGAPWSARRYQGYLRAMVEEDLTPQLSEEDADDYFQVGYMAAKSALTRSDRLTALVGASDLIAQGAYSALNDCHLRVPRDLSVTGFDDIGAAFLHPPLTTVGVFPEQIGKRLAETLFNRISYPDLAPQEYIIPTRVVRRASHHLAPSEQPEANEDQPKVGYAGEDSKGSNAAGPSPQPSPQAAQGTEPDQPSVADVINRL